MVYPESTPVIEAYRAMLDLKDTGIPVQLVIANQVVPAAQAGNGFFVKRRAMQLKYLNEIHHRFAAPVALMPLLDKEVRGLPVLSEAADLLFDQSTCENVSAEAAHVHIGGSRS